MNKYLLAVFFTMISMKSFADGPIKFTLENGEAQLQMTLHNTSSEAVLVNKRLAIGDRVLSEVYLDIEDLDGQKYPLIVKVKMVLANQQDLMQLWSNETVSQKTRRKTINKFHGLTRGEYKIKAIYEGLPAINQNTQKPIEGIFPEILISNSITYIVE